MKGDGTGRAAGLRVMTVALGAAAAEAAGEYARLGGYVVTPEQATAVSRALAAAAMAMVSEVADWSATSDEALEGAAREMGVRVVRELLGPAPGAN